MSLPQERHWTAHRLRPTIMGKLSAKGRSGKGLSCMTWIRGWIIVTGAVWTAVTPAWAHNWYPSWCCSDHDCRELLTTKGEIVTETPEGFRLWDGRFIGREHAKPSPDIRFHICEEPVTRAIVCFFAPQGQS